MKTSEKAVTAEYFFTVPVDKELLADMKEEVDARKEDGLPCRYADIATDALRAYLTVED